MFMPFGVFALDGASSDSEPLEDEEVGEYDSCLLLLFLAGLAAFAVDDGAMADDMV